jgi:hypothetical protein
MNRNKALFRCSPVGRPTLSITSFRSRSRVCCRCYDAPMSIWQEKQELHRIFQDARIHHNSYCEKLALLDGATVALVITAVLGPLHGSIKHKYLLGTGLTLLVIAMLALLWRNLQATQYEFLAVNETVSGGDSATREPIKRLSKRMRRAEFTGVWLSAVGIALLLAEVWLLLL